MIFWFDFERILRPLRQQLKDAVINHDRLANTCKVDLKFRIYLIEENNLIPPWALLWALKDLITCSFILYYFLTSVFAFFFDSCPAADQPSLNMAKMFLSVFFNQQKWKESKKDTAKQVVELVDKCPDIRVYCSPAIKYCNSPRISWINLGIRAICGNERTSSCSSSLGAARRGCTAPAPRSHVAYLKALYSNALWFFETQSQERNKSSDSCITVQLVSFVEYKLNRGCHGPLKAGLAECRTGSDKSR